MFTLTEGSFYRVKDKDLAIVQDKGTQVNAPYCNDVQYAAPMCLCKNGSVCPAQEYPSFCCDNSQWPLNFFQTWVFVNSDDPNQTIDHTKPLVVSYHGGSQLTFTFSWAQVPGGPRTNTYKVGLGMYASPQVSWGYYNWVEDAGLKLTAYINFPQGTTFLSSVTLSYAPDAGGRIHNVVFVPYA